MAMKLFDDDDNIDVLKIEIDEKYARRFEHNKKREDLQRYEELKKKGLIDDSGSESDSESSDGEDGGDIANKDIKFFENLIKVRNRDPSLYQNVRLFESESDDEDNEEEKEGRGNTENGKVNKEDKKKKKAKYLKDVMAQHLLEEGPEFEETEPSKKMKTYNEEQEELKKAFLDAVKDAEDEGEGEFLKVRDKDEVEGIVDNEKDDGEFQKKLGEYFGVEEELDENKMFLKEFFMNKMWLDKGNKSKKRGIEDDEFDELLKDEEEVEKQEKYEESYNFRYEENAEDRVLGHSRKVEGSVRIKHNARVEQRKNKEERMRIAEMERKEELKHLKNLKKKEMMEKMKQLMEVAGIKDDNGCPLDLDDLEEDFDPDEHDKMMNNVFNKKYHEAQDTDPRFATDDDEDDDENEKPDFDKEDELLGLPKGWDELGSGDGFLAARERILKLKMEDGDQNEKEKVDEGFVEESKRKRKRKMSLLKKVKEEMMEEYYKLDYEDTVGDLKTRFKYAKVEPNRYGLKPEEILVLDDSELNQYVSVKRIAPYREKEWKVPNSQRHQYKMRFKELLRGKFNDEKTNKKNRLKDDANKLTSDGKAELEVSNVDRSKLSRKARRKQSQSDLKLSRSRLLAYGKMQPNPKGKGKK